MIGYEKTNAKPFYGDPWNGGKYESKKKPFKFHILS